MDKEVTINEGQELFVYSCGSGYSCMGFNHVQDKIERLEKEMYGRLIAPLPKKGTMAQWKRYQTAIRNAKDLFDKTGVKLSCELNPLLIGKEGKRVEVIQHDGGKRRFIVGKSCGFIPCHLEIKTRRSSGGEKVWDNFHSVRLV